jgi:hypothetical protein
MINLRSGLYVYKKKQLWHSLAELAQNYIKESGDQKENSLYQGYINMGLMSNPIVRLLCSKKS